MERASNKSSESSPEEPSQLAEVMVGDARFIIG